MIVTPCHHSGFKDADVVILLLLYEVFYLIYGLNELWIQIGLGDNKHLLPVHRIQSRLGDEFCKSLLKCHLGTGCDYISKIGTKYSALQAQPDLYLRNFGESGMLDSQQIKNAEKYLVKIFSNTTILVQCGYI